MCTRVKVLGTIACVEEEGFVTLNLFKLMAKAFNLQSKCNNIFNSSTPRSTSDGVTNGGNDSTLDKTLRRVQIVSQEKVHRNIPQKVLLIGIINHLA
jgi:hypothetical protein